MPDTQQTIANLLADAFDLSGAEINNLLDSAPLIARMPWVPSSNGTSHKYVTWTTAPTVGFRAENTSHELAFGGYRRDCEPEDLGLLVCRR